MSLLFSCTGFGEERTSDYNVFFQWKKVISFMIAFSNGSQESFMEKMWVPDM